MCEKFLSVLTTAHGAALLEVFKAHRSHGQKVREVGIEASQDCFWLDLVSLTILLTER